jgi:GTPase SAR1 family protein
MGRHYYRNVDAVMFVYDVTDKKSFDALTNFVAECSNFIDYPVVRLGVFGLADVVFVRI